jgi:ATP-dependent DNA helicase RecQ
MANKGNNLTAELKRYFGFDKFKGDQEEIIRNVLAGNDTFVLMPTGGGKSLCYQLPALMMPGMAIVVSPLIALMKNQVDMIRNVSERDSVAHFLNSMLNRQAIEQVKSDIKAGITKLLYVAPESLGKEENAEFLKTANISFYAIDEAHCISEWGHDFRPDYRNLHDIIERIGRAPVIALTATATDKVKTDIKRNLHITDAREFKSSFNRPNLYYEVRPKTRNIEKEIIKYIKQNAGKSGIIYCMSRKRVEELAAVLRANDISAAPYHAGMDASARSRTQDDFIMERIDVIVATIAFGMGIDKPDVRFVIHYDMPKSLEGYYQETGRAGRDGREGNCIGFFSTDDLRRLEKLMEWKPIAEQEIGKQLLRAMTNYAESTVCRRKLLMHYFGEEYPSDNCGNCDNCLHPKEKIDAQEQLLNVLLTIQLTKENFKDDYIKDVLHGRETQDTTERHHDSLETFGIYEDEDDCIINAVIIQAELNGYIERSVEDFGVLKLTDKGHRFIKKPTTFMITKDNEFNEEESDAAIHDGGANAVDPALYQMLCDLRKELSKKLDIPPYVIFQDQSLEAMATIYPVTIDELQNIPGVGAGKARRYGAEFCELIRHWCEDNEIERPEDMRVRMVAKKSKVKVAIIHAIDRKVDLNDIALTNGLEFNELLDEMEAIVYSGTRINLDYFLEENMDEERIDEIYSYFKSSETDSLDDAIDSLDEDYTEEEIRLVRIKFISEMGN